MDIKKELIEFKDIFIQVLKEFIKGSIPFVIAIILMISYVYYLEATSPFNTYQYNNTSVVKVEPIKYNYSKYEFIVFATSNCDICNELVGDLLDVVNSSQVKILFIDSSPQYSKYFSIVSNITKMPAIPTTIIVYNGTPIVIAVGTFTKIDSTESPSAIIDYIYALSLQYRKKEGMNTIIIITRNITVINDDRVKEIEKLVRLINK